MREVVGVETYALSEEGFARLRSAERKRLLVAVCWSLGALPTAHRLLGSPPDLSPLLGAFAAVSLVMVLESRRWLARQAGLRVALGPDALHVFPPGAPELHIARAETRAVQARLHSLRISGPPGRAIVVPMEVDRYDALGAELSRWPHFEARAIRWWSWVPAAAMLLSAPAAFGTRAPWSTALAASGLAAQCAVLLSVWTDPRADRELRQRTPFYVFCILLGLQLLTR